MTFPLSIFLKQWLHYFVFASGLNISLIPKSIVESVGFPISELETDFEDRFWVFYLKPTHVGTNHILYGLMLHKCKVFKIVIPHKSFMASNTRNVIYEHTT